MPDSSGGNEGAGPRRLAQAIVNDYLGFDVDLVVASAFLRVPWRVCLRNSS